MSQAGNNKTEAVKDRFLPEPGACFFVGLMASSNERADVLVAIILGAFFMFLISRDKLSVKVILSSKTLISILIIVLLIGYIGDPIFGNEAHPLTSTAGVLVLVLTHFYYRKIMLAAINNDS